MTNSQDDEGDKELQKQKDLLHVLVKRLEQKKKDVTHPCSSIKKIKKKIEKKMDELKAQGFSSVKDNKKNSHVIVDEGDDDTGAFFPCPFCYVEIEVSVLCSHLQEEHCFDLKNAVCPLCAANLGKDAIGHFMVQHAHSLKRRRKSQKGGFWTSNLSSIGKELRGLNTFFGPTSGNYRGHTDESAPDPLLSPFLCSISQPDPKVKQNDRDSNNALGISDVKSKESSMSDEVQEQDLEERRRKVEFARQLIFSTIF